MLTSGPGEGGYNSSLFFTDTAPCGVGSGPYDAEWIAKACVAIPSSHHLGAKAAEYYVVIERASMQGGKWWSRTLALKPEQNYGFDTGPDTKVPVAIVKHGKTEDLNSGKDVIHPVPIP
jgi:hypothetical protein